MTLRSMYLLLIRKRGRVYVGNNLRKLDPVQHGYKVNDEMREECIFRYFKTLKLRNTRDKLVQDNINQNFINPEQFNTKVKSTNLFLIIYSVHCANCF